VEGSLFPPGFLGTRADVLIDIVMVSFAVILPTLIISWRYARNRAGLPGQLTLHRNIQITLCVTLTIVVAIFEYDLSTSGGIFALTAGSAYEGTLILDVSVYTHTLLAVATSVVWLGLVVASWFKFPRPPEPNAFSDRHRFWGRLGMVTMMLTGLTAIPLYYFGFVA
jgi:hypothetical protein